MAVHGADDRDGKIGEAFDDMRLIVWPGELFARGDVAKIVARREAPSGAAQYDDTDRRCLQVGDVGFERLEQIDIERIKLVRSVQRQLTNSASVGAQHEIIH
jgi:hypothetical protein